MSYIKFIDLFAGIGGFRRAITLVAKDLDIKSKCIAFSEIDNFAIQTYKSNYDTSDEIELGDIVSFTENENNVSNLPEFDIVFGGFPCQPFSMMGNQLGFGDDRGGLFFNVAKILDVKKPKYVLLENVRNLKNHGKGKTFSKLKETLDEYGYYSYEDIFDTVDFGLPQHRRRLYIFAVRKDLVDNPIEFSMSVVKKNFDKILTKSVNIYEDVTDGLLCMNEVDKKYYLSDKLKKTILSNGTKNFKSNSEINQLIARPLTATMVKMHRACQDNYYSQEFLDSNNKELYLKNSLSKEEEAKHRIRRLTPEEALKLQGFDREFFLNASKSGVSDHQLYKQAGNAVSVNVVYAILHYLITFNYIK